LPKARLRLYLALVLVALAVGVSPFLAIVSRRLDTRYRAIEPGMSRDEVIAILGPPDGSIPAYQKRPAGAHWTDGHVDVWIRFHHTGRLAGAGIYERPQQDVLGWIRKKWRELFG
jgi:hypothetical protein